MRIAVLGTGMVGRAISGKLAINDEPLLIEPLRFTRNGDSLAIDTKRVNAPLSLAWNRAAMVFAAVCVVLSTLFAPATVFEHAMFGYAAIGASFGPLLLVRLSGKRVRPGATLGALWSGFLLSLLFHLLPDSPGDFLERVLPFVTSLGIALTGGERRRNPDRADRSQETVHDRIPI